jgi:hypothetical protein
MIDPTRQALLESIARTPSPTRNVRQKRALIGYTVAGAWMLAVFAFASLYPHAAVRSASATTAVVLGLCALALMFSALVFARGASPLGRSHYTLTTVAIAVPCGVLSWLSLSLRDIPSENAPLGWRCFALMIVLGAVLLLAQVLANRSSNPIHPRLQGAAFGAVSGAWSAILVAAWCPIYNESHAVWGHVAPILMLSFAGAVLNARPFRQTSRNL